ncbi:MAG: TonB-dependent receptor [Flavobacteriaceae bacterium]
MKKILLFSLVFFLFKTLNGQTLQGVVINENKLPIEEVTIVNLRNGEHTHTDTKGYFIFKDVQVGDTLQLSHIGYETKSEKIKSLNEKVVIVLAEKYISLDEVIIYPHINALNLITEIDIQTDPVNSSQDILRQVPGLFIGQHAGGGKAEQLFIRGFDIDHGTDVNITVDGLPVNMVSHAHGQGYADLHFLIPETIDEIDFGKGPYYAHKGNFNTAAYVDFKTKKRLDESQIKFELGQFNTKRNMLMFNILNHESHNAYFASEYIDTDGPFDSPQNFNRINLFGKYGGNITNDDYLSVTTSYFKSKWDASGQIPQREIDNGHISRFGAIDDTEGGNTSRANFLINYDKYIDDHSYIKNYAFYSEYEFELYSNFTFFLNDPVNGDQIKQEEKRGIFGFNSEYNHRFSNDNIDGSWQLGAGLRNDQTKNSLLSHTVNRSETLEEIKLGNVNETNFSAYLNATFDVGKWTFNPAVRFDYFDFQYNDKLLEAYETQSNTKSIISPKLNILYNQSKSLQGYIKLGKGFHSNDTRVVVAENGKKILPAAYGTDIGFIWKPIDRLLINTAYWYLFLEQEFVYVGDEGVVEPSGKTQRQGVDLSIRYQPLDWLFWNFDANYANGKAIDENSGEDYIPLAPDFTFVTSLNMVRKSGLYGGVHVRHMGDRPANEDNSITASGYTVVDLNIGYEWKKFDFSIQIQNLFDTEWNETQFATESRLQNEPFPVEEIHFTPGTPFFLKGVVSFRF